MEITSISIDQKRRVQEVQNLLATGIEQLMLFYFDIQRHGFMIPGSKFTHGHGKANSQLMQWRVVTMTSSLFAVLQRT